MFKTSSAALGKMFKPSMLFSFVDMLAKFTAPQLSDKITSSTSILPVEPPFLKNKESKAVGNVAVLDEFIKVAVGSVVIPTVWLIHKDAVPLVMSYFAIINTGVPKGKSVESYVGEVPVPAALTKPKLKVFGVDPVLTKTLAYISVNEVPAVFPKPIK